VLEFALCQSTLKITSMSLEGVIQIINEMQADGVIGQYAIGGAVGATFYLEPAETWDVDVFFTLEANVESGAFDTSILQVYSYLKGRGAVVDGQYIVVADQPIQFLPPSGPLVEEAIREANLMPFGNIKMPVFSAEHLAAIALDLGRPKDRVRLAQFAAPGVLDSARFQDILNRYTLVEKWNAFKRSIAPR
jgi:hypothetical protein